MADRITVTGVVATIPHHVMTTAGFPVTTFRLASTHRKYDKGEGKWVDGDTNWFTVVTFRNLAQNIPGSVEKGQRVIVTGRLRVRDWEAGEKSGREVEIEADAVGHDLAWGTASYTKSIGSSAAAAADAFGDPQDAAPRGDGEGSEPVDLSEARSRREELPVPF
jgi:single-strand DNA-binding protein